MECTDIKKTKDCYLVNTVCRFVVSCLRLTSQCSHADFCNSGAAASCVKLSYLVNYKAMGTEMFRMSFYLSVNFFLLICSGSTDLTVWSM